MLLTWGMGGGLNGGGSQPSFVLGLADLGAGAVDTSSQGVSVTPTFTRATTAWTKLSTGLWASVASGTARSTYLGADTTVGAYGGYFAEGARTNLCLQARDLSDAAWTKVNTTAAKDQAGIDGVTNSASSLTCTVGGGTCLQTIVEAATTSGLSMFIKRITGTGTVTIQQGASTSDVTASINSTTYTRVELNASVLNPAIGITLGTGSDKIAVDMVQFENGAFSSSPITTTGGSVTRNADVLNYPISIINGSQGTVFALASVNWTGNAVARMQIFGTANNNGMLINSGSASTTISVNDGTTNTEKTGLTSMGNTQQPRAIAWGSDMAATGNGLPVSSSAFDGDMNGAITTFGIGVQGNSGTANPLFGTISRIAYFPNRLSNSALVAMTA